MAENDLLISTPSGLYCPPGDFYIDPWRPVERAVITHAHGDHARWGSKQYLCAAPGEGVLRIRLGPDARIESLPFGRSVDIRGVRVTLFPAGHILGSAQVRVEHAGRTWVASGDYKTTADRTCTPFEPIRCDAFITESTFGLPIYRWLPEQSVFDDVNAWWARNATEGRTSVVYAYALGKAQRLLSGVNPSIGPIFCHGAVERLNAGYRAAGVPLPETRYVGAAAKDQVFTEALVVAPPSARATPGLRRFGDYASAFASGWMQLRGTRRRRSVERGFVLSDHADWPGLQEAITATGARRILVTHGSTGPMVRWLREQGYEASSISTQYEGEQDEAAEPEPDEATTEAATSESAAGYGRATAERTLFDQAGDPAADEANPEP
jgi:putative mRNA 3-end processing factor